MTERPESGVDEESAEAARQLNEYSVEVAITGTWRDSVVAYDNAEAENLVEQQVESALADEDFEWGDLGMEVVGSRNLDNPE